MKKTIFVITSYLNGKAVIMEARTTRKSALKAQQKRIDSGCWDSVEITEKQAIR